MPMDLPGMEMEGMVPDTYEIVLKVSEECARVAQLKLQQASKSNWYEKGGGTSGLPTQIAGLDVCPGP